MDLRERAVARVAVGETIRLVVAVLQISVASVVKWSKRHHRTGSAAPAPMHGHLPRVLLSYRYWIVERTANGRAFTLRGLQAELAERGIQVDYRMVWSFIQDEGLTFKKIVLPSEQGRPDIVLKRAYWRRHQAQINPCRLVLVDG